MAPRRRALARGCDRAGRGGGAASLHPPTRSVLVATGAAGVMRTLGRGGGRRRTGTRRATATPLVGAPEPPAQRSAAVRRPEVPSSLSRLLTTAALATRKRSR